MARTAPRRRRCNAWLKVDRENTSAAFLDLDQQGTLSKLLRCAHRRSTPSRRRRHGTCRPCCCPCSSRIKCPTGDASCRIRSSLHRYCSQRAPPRRRALGREDRPPLRASYRPGISASPQTRPRGKSWPGTGARSTPSKPARACRKWTCATTALVARGYPDRDGHVTLDASIMDEHGNCGAVAAIEHIAHPISVARRVMEKTPHVLLVGDGALQFALEQGFPRRGTADAGIRKGVARMAQDGELQTRRSIASATATPHDGHARRYAQPRHARHAGARLARRSCRRMHDQRHGVEAARPRRRQPDHRRGPVCRQRRRRARHRPALARKSSATPEVFSSSS